MTAESTLVERVVAGDDSAFEEWMKDHSSVVRNCIFRVMRSFPSYIEDALQESFLAIWEGVRNGRFRGDSKLSTWACEVAKNKSLEVLRKGRSEKHGCPLTNRNVEINSQTNPQEPLDTHNFVEALEALNLVEEHFKNSRKGVYWRVVQEYFLQGTKYKDQRIARLDGQGFYTKNSTRASALRTLKEARGILNPRYKNAEIYRHKPSQTADCQALVQA